MSFTLEQLLHPRRFPGMSGRMAAIVGYIMERRYTDPEIVEMAVTSDGFVMATQETGENGMVGSAQDLMANWRKLLRAAELTKPQRDAAMKKFRTRIVNFGGRYGPSSRPRSTRS